VSAIGYRFCSGWVEVPSSVLGCSRMLAGTPDLPSESRGFSEREKGEEKKEVIYDRDARFLAAHEIPKDVAWWAALRADSAARLGYVLS